MRIISEKGEFQLPAGFAAEITSYNQVFNDQGEQSIPVTLPGTHRNLSILGYPNRVDAFYKPISSLQVDVVDDVFMRSARMVVHSADALAGISCTLYFREASFYALIDDMTMQDITLDVIQGVGETHEAKVQYLIDMLKSEYQNQTSNMFSVFPVQTQHQIHRQFEYTRSANIGGVIQPEEFVYEENVNLVLNGFKTNHYYLPDNTPEKNITLNLFQGEFTQKHIVNSTVIDIAIGYGMTAFVDVFYFIQKMADHLGYSFDDTQVRTLVNNTTGKLVILNNVADAIYDAKLDFNQLVPGLMLKDFLKKMAQYFAGVFYVDEVAKKIEFYSYQTVFETRIEKDLSKYMSSPLQINSAQFAETQLVNTHDEKLQRSGKVEYIEVNLPYESTYKMISHSSDGNRFGELTFELSLMSVSNVIHLNSSEVINGDTQKSDKNADSSNELVLCGVRKGLTISQEVYRPDSRYPEGKVLIYTYHYTKGYAAIYRDSENALTYLATQYQAYLDWKRDSNLLLSCEMHMPPDVLYSIDMAKQYVIDGQIFFIDQIAYRLPYDGIQHVTLRTFRKYEDRV